MKYPRQDRKELGINMDIIVIPQIETWIVIPDQHAYTPFIKRITSPVFYFVVRIRRSVSSVKLFAETPSFHPERLWPCRRRCLITTIPESFIHTRGTTTMAEADVRTEFGEKPVGGHSSDGGATDDKGSPDEQFEQERKIRGFRWVIVIISILFSVTLYSLDNTIVADIQPDIVDTYGELDKLPWLSVAFLVACVATNSIWCVGPFASIYLIRLGSR